jgi:hypothetical protein
VQVAKDKLDAARLEELTDNEETIAELKRRHEREKLLLLEDNKKLMMDLDTVSVTFLCTTFLLLLPPPKTFPLRYYVCV